MNHNDLTDIYKELLARYEKGGKIEDDNSDLWDSIFGFSVQKQMMEFKKMGLVKDADLKSKINYLHNITNLKQILKDNNIPRSGNKHELVEKVFQLNDQDLIRKMNNEKIVNLTEIGERIVFDYLQIKQSERKEVEARIIDFLKKCDYYSAAKEMGEFEKKQVFPRGMVDWESFNPQNFVPGLIGIFGDPIPKKLSNLAENVLETLRIVASMKYLWGVSDPSKWFPEDISPNIKKSYKFAINMLVSQGFSQKTLSTCINNKDCLDGIVFYTLGCCPECTKLSGKLFKLDEVPLLPYDDCTRDHGCICSYLPLTEGRPIPIT